MADLEKVIKGLECCSQMVEACRECPYANECEEKGLLAGMAHLTADALSLLKAQEPVSPKVDIDTYVCGVCGMQLDRQSLIGPNAVLTETFDYCPSCGRKVDWNGRSGEGNEYT